MIKVLTFIGLGSFMGGVARYGVGRLAALAGCASSLWGTFSVNVFGCFLIGLRYGLFDRYDGIDEHWRLFLTVGFCGGFTTFSTFAHESYTGITEGRFVEMLLYATLSFAIGLIMIHLGHILVLPRR